MSLCPRHPASSPSFLFGIVLEWLPGSCILNVVQLLSVAQWRPSSKSMSPCDDLPTSYSVCSVLDFCISLRVNLSWKPGFSPPREVCWPSRTLSKSRIRVFGPASDPWKTAQKFSLVAPSEYGGGQGLLRHKRIGSCCGVCRNEGSGSCIVRFWTVGDLAIFVNTYSHWPPHCPPQRRWRRIINQASTSIAHERQWLIQMLTWAQWIPTADNGLESERDVL